MDRFGRQGLACPRSLSDLICVFAGEEFELSPSILHRLANQVKAQQWFTVAIELMIVILGVFIGIEAANWNARRNDRQDERRYYQQIISDLDTDISNAKQAAARSRKADEAAEFVLACLDDERKAREQPGHLAMSILRAGFLNFHYPARQTYDELISTGKLGVLRDPQAKAELARYYAVFAANRQWDGMVRDQQSAYWSESAGILPRAAQRLVIKFQEPPMTAAETSEVLAALKARPRLRNMLSGMAVHQAWIQRDAVQRIQEAQSLQAELRSRLADLS